MENKKEMTALNSSVSANEEQSVDLSKNRILENSSDYNNIREDFEKMQKEMIRQMDPSYLHAINMKELFDRPFIGKPSLIEGLLYTGTHLFVGAPKIGKSFMMAQIAYHVSTGTPLWNFNVRKGKVLYLALEDNYSRLQKRLYKMFGTEDTENLFLSISVSQLGNGLDEQLQSFMQEHADTNLIIIDTLQKVRENSGESYSYANDYAIITRLKKFADSYGICLLLVHHTRKQQSEDKFDAISGTNGLLGAADGAFIMQKEKRTDNEAMLDVVGRDQQDQRLKLLFDREHCTWQLTNVEVELWKEPADPILESVSQLVTMESPQWIGSATELIECLGLEIKPNAMTRRLNISVDRLWNDYGIRYESSHIRAGSKVKFDLTIAEA